MDRIPMGRRRRARRAAARGASSSLGQSDASGTPPGLPPGQARVPRDARARARDHELLASELDVIRVDAPDIYAVIQANMEEFKALMTEGDDRGHAEW